MGQAQRNNEQHIRQHVEFQLLQTASIGGMTTYQRLGSQVGLEPYNPILWGMLGDLSEQYYESHGLLLSALVVNSETGFPGKQFFTEIAKPKFKFKNQLEFWCQHVSKIHKEFKK